MVGIPEQWEAIKAKLKYQEVYEGEFKYLLDKRVLVSEPFKEALLLFEKNELLKAYEKFKEHTTNAHMDYLAELFMGFIHVHTNSKEDPSKHFEMSLVYQPNHNINAHFQKGQMYLYQKQYLAAIDQFIKVDALCYTNGKTAAEIFEIIKQSDPFKLIEYDFLGIPSELPFEAVIMPDEIPEDEVYFEAVDFVGFKQEEMFANMNEKPIPDIVLPGFNFAMALTLLSEKQESAALWYLERCHSLASSNDQQFAKVLSVLVGVRNSKPYKPKDLQDIAMDIDQLCEKGYLNAGNIPKIVDSFYVCMNGFDKKHNCEGYCVFFAAIEMNDLVKYQLAIMRNQRISLFKLTKAKFLMHSPFLKDAESLLLNLISQYGESKNSQALYLLCKIYFERKDFILFNEKSALINEKELQDKKQMRILYMNAVSQNRANKFLESFENLIKCKNIFTSIDSNKKGFQIDLKLETALSLTRLGMHEKAQAEIESISMEECPMKDKKRLKYMKAQIFYGQKRYKDSQELFQEVIDCPESEIEINNSHYWLGMIELNSNNNQPSEDQINNAVEQFKREIPRNHTFSLPHFQLGKIYLQRKQLDEALQSFLASIRTADRIVESYQFLLQITKQQCNFSRFDTISTEFQANFPAQFSPPLILEYAEILRFHIRDCLRAIKQYQLFLKFTPDHFYCLFSIAMCKIELGMENSIETLLNVQKMYPNRIESSVKLAYIFANNLEFEQAKKYAEISLKINPSHVDLLSTLGMIELFEGHNYKLALRYFKKALLNSERDAKIHYLCGLAYNQAKKPLKAELSFRLASELDNTYEAAQFELAKLLFESNNFSEALEVLQKLKRPPNQADTFYFMQGKCHSQLNDSKSAYECFVKCVHEGWNNDAIFIEAIEEVIQEQYSSSEFLEVYQLLTTISSIGSHPVGLVNKYLGMASMGILNRYKTTRKHLIASLAENPNSIICAIRLAQCNLELNSDPKVVQAELDAIPIEKVIRFIEFTFLQADIYQKSGEFQLESECISSISIERLRGRQKDHFLYVKARSLESLDGHSKDIFKLLDQNIKHAPSLWFKGQILEKEKENATRSKIVTYYENSLKLEETFSPCLKSIGDSYFQLGKIGKNQSKKYYELFCTHSELPDITVMLNLAEIHKQLGSDKRVIELCQSVLEESPKNVRAQIILGEMYFIQKEIDLALEVLIAVDSCSENNYEVKFIIAQCQVELNKFEAAKDILIAIPTSFSNSAAVLQVLGEVYIKLADYSSARISFEQSLILDRNRDGASFQLAELYFNHFNLHQKALKCIEDSLKIDKNNMKYIRFYFQISIELKRSIILIGTFQIYGNFLNSDHVTFLKALEICFQNPPSQQDISKLRQYYLRIVNSVQPELVSDPNNLAQLAIRTSQISLMLKDYEQFQLYLVLARTRIQPKSKYSAELNLLEAQLRMLDATPNTSFAEVHNHLTEAILSSKIHKQEKLNQMCKIELLSLLLSENKGKQLLGELRSLSETPSRMLLVNAEIAFKQAHSLNQKSKEYKELIAEGESYLDQHSKLAENQERRHYVWGMNLFDRGDFFQAGIQFKGALKCSVEPSVSIFSRPLNKFEINEITYRLALISGNENEIIEALTSLVNAGDIKSISQYVERMFEKGDSQKVQKYSRIILKIDPTNARMYFLLSKYQQLDMSIMSLKRCKQFDPFYPNIDLILGNAYELNNDIYLALRCYLPLLSYKDPNEIIILKCVQLLTILQQFNHASTLISRYESLRTFSSPEMMLAKAHLQQRKGLLEDSLETLRIAHQNYFDNLPILISMTSLLSELHKTSEIILVLSRTLPKIDIISKDSDIKHTSKQIQLAELYSCLCVAYISSGRHKEAVEFAQILAELNINQELEIKSQLINSILDLALGKLDRAKEQLMKLEDKSKYNILAIFILGVLLVKLNEPTAAIKKFKRCLEINSQFAPAAVNLSILLRNNFSLFQESIHYLLPFKQHQIQQINPLYHLALSFFSNGENAKAAEIVLKLISNYDTLSESNQEKKFLNLTIESPSTQSKSLLSSNIAKCVNNSGDFVISYVRQTLKQPTKEILYLLLSRIYRKMNRIDQELNLLNKVLAKYPDNPAYMYTHAVSMGLSDRNYSGIDTFNKCIQLDPKRRSFYLLAISNELHRKGQFMQEILYLRSAIQSNPYLRKAYDNLGAVYMQTNQLDLAKEAFMRSVELNPNEPDPIFNLGNVLLAKKEIQPAILEYEKVLMIHPNHLEALNNLGIAYMLINQLQSAANCFQKCCNIDISSDKYSKKLLLINKRILQQNLI